MNFFLLYVSLPALLFGIMSETPFSEIAKTTPCKVEMGPGSQALGPFASALADALPGRRQPLAHREPPQRAEQIGRASCRERGWGSVGAGALKGERRGV